MKRIVAIDGPSGAGKSTVAKLVAQRLGFRYLDTGALYRAVGLGLVRAGLHETSTDEAIATRLRTMRVEFQDGKAYLDGQDVSEDIRTPEAGHYSSVFSARRPVRESLMPIQKAAALNEDLVAEGRDMTTVVFPDAWGRFYLDATAEARAMRRYLQLQLSGKPVDMERARADVDERDLRDSSRDLSPLRVAEGVAYMDTSHAAIEDVVEAILHKLQGGVG